MKMLGCLCLYLMGISNLEHLTSSHFSPFSLSRLISLGCHCPKYQSSVCVCLWGNDLGREWMPLRAFRWGDSRMPVREYKTRNVNFQGPKSNWTVSNRRSIMLHNAGFSWSEKWFLFLVECPQTMWRRGMDRKYILTHYSYWPVVVSMLQQEELSPSLYPHFNFNSI